MHEEFTAADLHRAMKAVSETERLRRMGRIGWIIAFAAGLGVILLWVALQRAQPSKVYSIEVIPFQRPEPTPSPSPEPTHDEDGWGSEPTRVQVSAHPENLMEKIVAAAHLCGIKPKDAIRLVARESGFRQFDDRGNVLRSSSGALGLTQVKRSSAAEISPSLNIETEWGNLLAGLCYLRKQRGDMKRKLLAYRDGPNHRGPHSKAAHAYVSYILEIQ